ncbi:MAG TPA: iron-sulfur cluster repair di-iron protein [Edaphocola sp.]|nr:iron-sulfur cluster repair di-iron protein [Edaphocola sp.]
MSTEIFLDVTQLAPREKHPAIFRYFDGLNEGESFILHNDHDPKPLYYQLLGERGAIFDWDYLAQGPEVYEIRIAKKVLNGSTAETVGNISAKDYRKAEVFKKLGIDFCCGGDRTLKEASAEAGMTEEQLRSALEEADAAAASAPSMDFDKWDLDFLADYIRQTHHRYIRDNAELIAGLAQKIAGHHGVNHPELNELAPAVHHMLNDLLQHMEKEEKVLFPAIKNLVETKNSGQHAGIKAGTVSQPIKVMEAEHDHTGNDLKHFRRLTNDYTLPSDACNSYRYLFEKLKEFEDDTFRHVHLENNILFPKAIKMERELTAM